jgi:hypothetical protein
VSDRVDAAEKAPRTRVAVVGGAIAVYAVFDTLIIGLPTLVLSARYDSLRVFAIAAVAVALLNVACCTWVDNHWGEWVAGSGARVETRLQNMRDKKSLQRPVSWIEQGNPARYALAAAIVNAILIVGTARIITGRPVGSGRIRVASISYALIFTGVYSLCGYMLGRLIALF